MATAGTRHVALLRGINVGGKNKLPMKELSRIFENAGARDVGTYIQSGNVLFEASAAVARRIAADVSAGIEKRFGYRVPVVVRTADELRRVPERNPFLRAGADPATLHVAFLAEKPGAARVRGLDPGRSPHDEFTVRGREIFLRLPGGVARSKLTNAWFDAQLAGTSTMRNWRTVLKLIELAAT